MPVTRRSQTVRAEPDEVWAVIADPHHLPRWWPRVRHVEDVGSGRWTKVMATEKGREKNPKLKIGICGEHGGDPSSIEFFYSVGLDYVSCSPFRVLTARLAAAQAAAKENLGLEAGRTK